MSVALKIEKHIPSPIDPMALMDQYTSANIGGSFTTTHPKFHPQSNVWWSLVSYQAQNLDESIGVGRIELDAKTGKVIPLSKDEIRTIQEKAAILDAKEHGELPLDPNGMVLREYARKEANQFLWDHLGMHYSATEPRFMADSELPQWQFTIIFKMYDLAPINVGEIEVNARSGIHKPLNSNTISQILEEVNATLRSQTSSAEAI